MHQSVKAVGRAINLVHASQEPRIRRAHSHGLSLQQLGAAFDHRQDDARILREVGKRGVGVVQRLQDITTHRSAAVDRERGQRAVAHREGRFTRRV